MRPVKSSDYSVDLTGFLHCIYVVLHSLQIAFVYIAIDDVNGAGGFYFFF